MHKEHHDNVDIEPGISLLVDYGIKTGLIIPKKDKVNNHILSMRKVLLHCRTTRGNVDWFAALIYLLHGHLDESSNTPIAEQKDWGTFAQFFLEKFEAYPFSLFLWPEHGARFSTFCAEKEYRHQNTDIFLLQLAHILQKLF